jgi:small-conductance mechanosensitive channel
MRLVPITVPIPVVDTLHRVLFGNTVQAWLTAALSAAILFLVLVVVRRILVSRIGALAARTSTHVDDTIVAMLEATRTWVCAAFAVLTSFSALDLGRVGPHLPAALKLVVLWQLALWGGAAIAYWMQHHLSHRTTESDRTSVAMITAIGVMAKVLLWTLVVITALTSVFAINITPLITGLGVSGIAVALAVQNILGDLLAALAIVFDKPFDIGDPIGVDQVSGTVERIGLKTTHLRSLSGEQIIIGNSDLLKSRLRNYRRMQQRRVVLNLDVTYDTPVDLLATLPGVIQQIVMAQSPVKFDRSHLSSFGESAIRFETVYIVLVADYTKYMDIQQAIDLEVLRRFAALNVKLAFPTQTLYHEGLPVAPPPAAEPPLGQALTIEERT